MNQLEQRLLAAALRWMDRQVTKGAHLAMVESNEHLGVCNTRRRYVGGTRVKDGAGYRMADQTLDGECSPLCVEFTADREAIRAYVDEHETRQMTLLDVAS